MNDCFDFLKLAEDRYSVRKFNGEPLEDEDIEKILQAGYLAPTACNRQPQRILVINNEESLGKLKKCTRYHFDAPAAMLVCQNKNECWQREYDGKKSGDIDASIVTTHMMLEASSIGIGTTWVMYFEPDKIRSEFSVPDEYEIVALLVMGYAADDAAPKHGHKEYRPKDEIIFYNKF